MQFFQFHSIVHEISNERLRRVFLNETRQHGKCFKMISLARLLKTVLRHPKKLYFYLIFSRRRCLARERIKMSLLWSRDFLLFPRSTKRRRRKEKIPRTWRMRTHWCNVSLYTVFSCEKTSNVSRKIQASSRNLIFIPNAFLCIAMHWTKKCYSKKNLTVHSLWSDVTNVSTKKISLSRNSNDIKYPTMTTTKNWSHFCPTLRIASIIKNLSPNEMRNKRNEKKYPLHKVQKFS